MLESLGNLLRAGSGQPGSVPLGQRGRLCCGDAGQHTALPAVIPGHCQQPVHLHPARMGHPALRA